MNKIFIVTFFLVNSVIIKAQDSGIKVTDYKNPKTYNIGGVTVSGVENLDKGILLNMSGLKEGDKITIPGEKITEVVKKFWKQGLFEDVKITITKIEGNNVFLDIYLQERPRVSELTIKGVNKSDQDDLKEAINLKRGSQVTENELNRAVYYIKEHYREKGFFNTQVKIEQEKDTTFSNHVKLTFDIDKNKKVKIENIIFSGNTAYTNKRLRRVMKKTKQIDWNIFKGSKYLEDQIKEDRESLYTFYNENGYRDFRILNDSIQIINHKRINLYIDIYEGEKFYFRNITWVGNTVYPSEMLNWVLGIKKGDIYNKTQLDKRINMDEDAIASMYMDHGYLFYSLMPVETKVEGDSIDIEMQIYEGKQATINEIIINGNTKTNEHVVRREIRTKPGELFSREKIIRTVRELAQLGHFNPETINPVPLPNQADGTVDIEYNLEEKANDQLELSGGWGGYSGFIGTIGVRFTNFSAGRMFEKKAWRPIPTGDGQTLSIRASSNGAFVRSINCTFIEPWLGGKKPNNFSISVNKSVYQNFNNYITQDKVTGRLGIFGASIGLGKRLSWPDDYFIINNTLGFQLYNNDDYSGGYSSYFSFLERNGKYNLLSLTTRFGRNSQDQLIYPRIGSNIMLTAELTPPYSLISGNFDDRLVEYHKWTFDAKWYHTLVNKLVLHIGTDFGVLGRYNHNEPYSSIGGFSVGTDLMEGMYSYGIDIIPVRGYKNGALTPTTLKEVTDEDGEVYTKEVEKANIYNKYTAELRYLISPSPQATIYGLIFAEGGNGWSEIKEFNPFDIKRSVGVGVRALLPMFGMLGIDFGYGFDRSYKYGDISEGGGKSFAFHFTLGQSF